MLRSIKFQSHKSIKYIAFTAFCIFLIACARFPTAHPDPAKNNPATYTADLKDCAQSYPETPDGVYLKNRISCMELKGWK